MNIYLGQEMSAFRYCAARPSVASRSFSGAFPRRRLPGGENRKGFFFFFFFPPRSLAREPRVKRYFIVWWALFTEPNTYLFFGHLHKSYLEKFQQHVPKLLLMHPPW